MEILCIPRRLLRDVPAEKRVDWNRCLSVGIVAVFVAVAARLPHVCVFQTYLGIPCPGCGITSSLRALGELDVREAWRLNPAGLLIAAGLVVQLVAGASGLLAKAGLAQKMRRLMPVVAGLSYAGLFVVWVGKIL